MRRLNIYRDGAMKEQTIASHHERILKVLIHMQERLDEPPDLPELARLACMSESHFHRVFKGMLGETVMEHLRRIRLERAAQHLRYTGDAVTEVAFEAGYETPEAFSRSFRALFGASPSTYRKGSGRASSPDSGVHYLEQGERAGLNLIPSKELTMDVTIKPFEPLDVAFVRHIGPYKDCGPAWETLCGWAGPRGLLTPETRFIGLSHDDPQITPEEKVRYDACLTLARPVEPEGRVGVQVLPGGDYAVALHKGPFENLERSYAEIFGVWLPGSGREVRNDASCMEVYLNDPSTTPLEELLTELRVPLRALG